LLGQDKDLGILAKSFRRIGAGRKRGFWGCSNKLELEPLNDTKLEADAGFLVCLQETTQ
jgi:hypothetical protein